MKATMYLKYQNKLLKVSEVVVSDNAMTYRMLGVLEIKNLTTFQEQIKRQEIEFTRILGSEQFSDSVSFIFDADAYETDTTKT